MIEKLAAYDIILASQSPRRQQLLEGLGLKFRVVTFPFEEIIPDNLPPHQAAEFLAMQKADACPGEELRNNSLLITADTIVVKNGIILGKPSGREEALAMLRSLSNCTHEVITGVCLRTGSRSSCFHSLSRVSFKAIPEEELVYYVDRYHPFDKAGAYGIQEWIGYTAVERIEGSYYNVMGLPTFRLWEELRLITI